MRRTARRTLKATARRPDYTGTPYQMLFRKAAVPVTNLLLKTAVTPNQVTLTATLLYIVPALLLFQENLLLNVLAIPCFYLINILDKADGQLARAKGVTSRRGIFIDGILHNVSIVAVYVPLGLRWLVHHDNTTVLIAAFTSAILILMTGFNYLNRTYLLASVPGKERDKLGMGKQSPLKRVIATLHSIPNQHFPEILLLGFIAGTWYTNAIPALLYLYLGYNAINFFTYAYLLSHFD